jgi:hypothetical protein
MKIVLILILLSLGSLFAEELNSDTTEIRKRDTLCFKYNFKVGDVLKYKVISYDSIMIDTDKALIKNRTEEIEIKCDSILKNGNYILKYKLTSAKSIESSGDDRDIVSVSHPFINKVVRLEIDSLGKRIFTLPLFDKDAIVAPGGAFQPNIIFNLGQSCKAVNESWIEESKDTLYENSNPSALLDQMTLFRLKGIKDTLNDKCTRMELMRSSKGLFKYIDGKEFYNVRNSINHYGILDISIEKMIPVHYFATSEQKLKIAIGNGEIPKEGKHFTSLNYTLISVENIPPIEKRNTKPIKKSKKK